MGFSQSDITRDECMLTGRFGEKGYDWWWHSFTGRDEETGEEKSFFIEFFLCNPNKGEGYPVLGQSEENRKKGRKPSYLCVKAGTWGEDASQINRYFGWEEIELSGKAPFAIAADDCYLSEKGTEGKICVTEEEAANCPELLSDAGKMSWKLKIDKKIPFNVGYGADKPLRELEAFEMFWHAEGMKTAYSGVVYWNGRKYIVTPWNCYGYADKNWGSNFTSPWVWLSSNDLVSRLTGKRLKNSVFDIGGGKPRAFGIPLGKRLLGAFYYEGKEYEFNFSKLWALPKTRFELTETEDALYWKVKMGSRDGFMIVEIKCLKKDMIQIRYEAPDGTMKHKNLWNGGNGTGRVRLYERQGNYCKLVDDMNVGHTGCEFGVFEDDYDI